MSYLLAKDTVNGAEGKVFITVDGKNIEVACMRNITTNADIQSNDMRVIGTRKIQDKPSGVKQTGKGNVYYGTDLFTNMVSRISTPAECRSSISRSPTTTPRPPLEARPWSTMAAT